MNQVNNPVHYFSSNSYEIVKILDLGTTSHIYVLQKEQQQYIGKVPRIPGKTNLLTEYRLLQYLNSTPLKGHVPVPVQWIPELGGFLMEYRELRYPTQAEREDRRFVAELARLVKELHKLETPAIPGLPDDRPEPSRAVIRGFEEDFRVIQREEADWKRLSAIDRRRLERVREVYHVYAQLAENFRETGLSEAGLSETDLSKVGEEPAPALIHGDLAGDNIMLVRELGFDSPSYLAQERPPGAAIRAGGGGKEILMLLDWGNARISSALADVANLLVYQEWSPACVQQFMEIYYQDDRAMIEKTRPILEALVRLVRYRACLRSLEWLESEGETGLDEAGSAFFERQVQLLD